MTAPEEFSKAFAGMFGRQDAVEMAGLLTDDADVLTLTGAMVEGAKAAETAFASEFAGIFAAARLVTGKVRLRTLGPGAVVLTQRFVVSGARDDKGQDMPRFGTVVSAVLVASDDTWRAASLTFSAIA